MKKHLLLSFTFLLFTFITFAQNNRGIVKGRIYDKYTNEGIPFANIAVWNTTMGGVSDSEGNYEIRNIPPGYIRLSVSVVGYETMVTSDILVTNAKSARLDIGLQEQNIQLETVVIRSNPFIKRSESPVSIRTLDISEIEKTPGADRDISRVVQTLPGVASSPGYRNDLIVRGGGANENAFYLDDVQIPNINHFATQGASGGPNGIINTDFIREANFYSGAFPANKGNALSSILDLKLIEPNTENWQHRITAGFTDAAFSTNGPITRNSGLVFSLRRSYLDLLFGLLKLPFLPTYTDAQFKYKYRISDKQQLTILGLGAVDRLRLNLNIKDPDDSQRYLVNTLPTNNQETYTLGAVYKVFDNKGFFTFVLSRNYLNNSALKYFENNEVDSLKTLDYRSFEEETKFRAERQLTAGNFEIKYGLGGQYAAYGNNTFARRYQNGMAFDRIYNSKLSIFSWNLFGQVNKAFLDDRLDISIGIRSDANNYSNQMNNLLDQLSPRVSASYALSDKWGINFNTGRYYQLPPYTTLGFRTNDEVLINKVNKISYMSVDHLIAGVEYYPDEKSKISIEGFYKWYHNYPFSVSDSVAISSKGGDYGVFGDEEVISSSEGNAYGFEILARDKDLWGFNFILSYTFVRSQFENINKVLIPAKWDNRHLFNLTALKSLPNNWEIGFRWRYVGGAPYTPYDLDKSSLVQAWNATSAPYLNYGAFNTLRLPSFHQLDIRIDKEWFLDTWSIIFFVDIQNLYNFKFQDQSLVTNLDENGIPHIINPQDPPEDQRYELREIKNESGTIIPSFGIIVEF